MTACVNEEKKMKGGALSGKVARTFLAGALAATMVPSVAYADVTSVEGDQAAVMAAGNQAVLDSVAVTASLTYNGTEQEVEVTFTAPGTDCPEAGEIVTYSVEKDGAAYIADTNLEVVSENPGEGQIAFVSNSDGTFKATTSFKVTDAGSYTVTANGKTDTLTVSPKTVTIDTVTVADDAKLAYNGTAQTIEKGQLTVTDSEGNPVSADLFDIEAGTNSGTMTGTVVSDNAVIKITDAGKNDNYNIVTADDTSVAFIRQATATDIAVDWANACGSVTYGGTKTLSDNDVTLKVGGQGVKGNSGTVTVEFDDAGLSSGVTTTTPIGEYGVTVEWTGNTNVEAGSAKLTFKVVAQQLTGTLNLSGVSGLVYDGTDLSEGIGVSSFSSYVEGVDYEISFEKKISSDRTYEAVDEIVEPGTYRAVATGKGVYGGKVESDDFTVSQAQANTVGLAWDTSEDDGEYSADGETKTVGYTGGSHAVEVSDLALTAAEAYAIPDEDVVIEKIELNGAEVDEIKAVGTYTVTVRLEGNENYADGNVGTLTLVVENAHNMTANEAFAKGTLAEAKDAGNYSVDVDTAISWTYDRKAHYVVPTKVLPYGETEAVNVDNDLFTTTYEKYNESNKTWDPVVSGANGCVNVGKYRAVVTPQADSGYEADAADGTSKAFYANFEIKAIDISGAILFDDGNDVQDLTDTVFTWNAGTQEVGVALDGVDISGSVTVSLYDENKSKIDEITDPGTYYVGIAAKEGTNYAGSVKDVKLTVDKLDLADAGLFVNDTDHKLETRENADMYLALANEDAVKDLKKLKAEIVASLDSTMTENGEYTLTVAPKSKVEGADGIERESFVTGSWSASFNLVETVVPAENFYYGGESLADFDGEVFNAENATFDPSKVVVYKTGNVKYDASQYEVTVTKDGKAVTDYSEPGDYVLTVSMKPGADYALGGKATAEFSVVSGSLAECDVIVTDAETGKVVPTKINQITDLTSAPFTYDGADVADNFGVKVEKDGEALAEGSDYKVVVTTGDSWANGGKVVDGATAVGTYFLNVVGVNYADWTAVKFVVSPIDVDQVRFSQETYDWNSGAFHKDDATGIPYTGSAVAPKVQYSDDNGATWTDLPTELYRLDNFQTLDAKGNWVDIDASEVVAAGSYKADVLFLDCELAENYDFAGVSSEGIEFFVIDRVAFDDVQASQWYAHSVVDAYNAGYINGYSGTKLFGPDNAIKRGDVACILFNVASVSKVADQDFWVNQGSSYSAFSDVEPGVYWTGAINWAANAEVVNGFAGTDQFGADQAVTREALASMLANYAKAMKVYKAPASTDLSSFDDADGVSGWALDNVAWAVENGIMGNGGYIDAQGEITRAEVAAMVMNFVEEFNLA